jgi:hypothetical protein
MPQTVTGQTPEGKSVPQVRGYGEGMEVEALQADLATTEGVDKLYAAAKGRQIDALTPAGVLADQHREMAARHHKELIDPSQFGLSLLPETLRSTASVPFGERYIGGSRKERRAPYRVSMSEALADPVENPIQIGRVS